MIERKLNLTDQEIMEIMHEIIEEKSATNSQIAELFQFITDMKKGINSKALNDKITEFMRNVIERGIE